MKRLILLLTITLLGLTFSPALALAQTPTAFGEAWESVSCDTFGVAPAVAAQSDCGYVTVPENRAAGSNKTIQLGVVRVRSTSANPGSPVVLGTGGPGGYGLQDASDAGFLTSHAGILADRDWVLFSQRGTAKARPELVCSAYNDVPLQGALNGWTDEEKQARGIEAMQACLADLAAQGVDLTGYNSVENAADVADLTRTLGYDKINYYGQSYGTLLGQYLLRDHPDIIETVTLDGIAPASTQRWTDVTDFAASFQRVFTACAADKACAANYPDPEGALAEALAAMDANPPMVTVQLPGGQAKTLAVDEVLAMNALFINLYLPGGYGKVPFLAYELRDGNYDQLAATLSLHFLNSGNAEVMHMAMVCSDDPVTSLAEVDVTNVPDIYKGIILDDASNYATFCPKLNLPQLPASSDEMPVSDVPALLLQGGLDPATPVDGGNKLVAGLSNNYNVIFPSGAHVQASSSPCALSILDAFLTDPTTAPDTSCVDPALSFAVPGPVSASSADGQAVITMTLPAGFVAGPQPNQWNDGAMILALDAFETGTSAADALAKPLGVIQLPDAEPVDGPMIAGYPSLTNQVVLDFNGIPQHVDRFAFADGNRAYRLLLVLTNPATLDKVRQTLVPEVLESITISGASNPASGSVAPAKGGFSDAWEAVSCDTFGLSEAVAKISDCGYVTVPEFHNQPAGPTIQVAVVRTRSSSDTPAPDPLFMEQGGPGGSTIDIYPTVALAALPNMKTLLNTRDLVFVEQRGTRHSKPSLLCPEQTAANVATLQGVQDKDDVTFLQACYARLQAEGVNFDAFNTVQNAADMYAVAEALGYPEFSYYGVSYGTLLGQYVIAQAKEHPVKLRSVIIDAVVAPDVDFNDKSGDTASYALRNVFTGCAQDEVCNRDFPNLESVFLGLVDQLNRQPITLTVTVPEDVRTDVPDAPATIEATITGEEFADLAFHHLYSRDKGRILPRHIYAAAKNNDFSWVAQGLADGLKAGTATGMYFTMLCSRQNSVTNAGKFFGTPFAQLTYKDDDSDFFQGCQIFKVNPEGKAFTFDDNSTPTLILNGANDPITPQPYGEYVGSLLDTAYVYTFPGMGHGTILDSPCAAAIAVSFLADPTQGPDSSCLSSLKPVFYGYPTPLDKLTLVEQTLPSSVTLALPSQWTLGSMNFYTDPNDPASFATGGALVAFVAGKSPAEAAALLSSDFKEIARDQVIGSHTWMVLEETQPGFVVNRVGVAADEAAGGTVLVQLSAAPATAEAVFAALWEPILSSVKVGAVAK